MPTTQKPPSRWPASGSREWASDVPARCLSRCAALRARRAGLRPAHRGVALGPRAATAWTRNHVSCLFASWRVAATALSRSPSWRPLSSASQTCGSRRNAWRAVRRAGRRVRAARAPRPPAPAASMASKRWAMRWCSQARDDGSSDTSAACRRALRRVSRLMPADKGRPVNRQTSSARWMRCASAGASRAAVTGSTAASSACSAASPVPRLGVDALAHAGIGLGHGVQPFAQGLEVQHRAAHQQRQVAALRDFADEPLRVGDEARRRVGQSRVEDVDQVVRHLGALGRAGLGGADVMPR